MQKSSTTMFNKDDIVTVRIDDIGSSGEGIGKADGFTLFIKDALIGDVVKAKIMKVKKNFAYARLLEIQTPSPDRTQPVCPIARQCGGCQIQQMDYSAQLRWKEELVRNDLLRIGGFDEETIRRVLHPVIGMEEPYHYRNKAQFPVGSKNGKPITGFYAGRTHYIIPATSCPISAPVCSRIMEAVLGFMEENKVSAYDEETGKGIVRHVLIRNGIYSGQVMVCLVINAKHLPAADDLVRRLAQIEGMASVSINVNTRRTNVIMGTETSVLWGEENIKDSLHILDVEYPAEDQAECPVFSHTGQQVTFGISPLSFYQVNPKQTEKIYSLVRHFAALTGREIVWDLYCGVGTISQFLASDAGRIYGVEVIPQAIENARENVRRNGITNAEYQVGKAEEVLPTYVEKITSETGSRPVVDVVIVDPPRKGCDEQCLNTILEVQPEKLIYVSCDPATLSRDLKILTEGGYEIKTVQPVDNFPHTVHIETIVLLQKLNS